MAKPSPAPPSEASRYEIEYPPPRADDVPPRYGIEPPPPSADVITSDVIPANTTSLTEGTDMPLFRRIGEQGLQAYAWIETIGSGGAAEYGNLDYKVASFVSSESTPRPITYGGLSSLRLNNEYGKHPQVEVELYDPLYRSPKSALGDLSDRLKVGTKINVSFGYSKAYTKWSNLKVTSCEVTLRDGTCKVSVRATMGHALKATTSSDVYTNSAGKDLIDNMAGALGIDVDKSKLLEEELNTLLSEDQAAAVQGMSYMAQKAGVTYYFDTESGSLKLETPFKYELIKKGAKPSLFTYGYAVSPISSIDYRVDYPKLGRSNAKGKTPNTHKPTGVGVYTDRREIIVYVGGVFDVLNAPVDQYGLKSQISTVDLGIGPIIAKSIDDVYIQYPKSEGYIVEEATAEIYLSDPSQRAFNLKKVFETDAASVVEGPPIQGRPSDVKVTQGAGGKVFLYNAQSIKYGSPSNKVIVSYRVYEFSEAVASVAPPKAEPKPQSTVEQISWVKIDESEVVVNKQAGIVELNRQIDARERAKESAASNPNIRYREEGNVYWLEERPQDGNSSTKEQTGGQGADPAVAGARTASLVPKSQEVVTPKSLKAKRKLPKYELVVKMKAGDWSLRVGRIIEIMDAHKKLIDGFWYIHKEEHSISTDGFQTTVTCRKALKREVDQYGKGKLKSPTGTAKPKSSEQGALAPLEVKAAPTREQQVQIERERKFQELKKISPEAAYAPTRGRIR